MRFKAYNFIKQVQTLCCNRYRTYSIFPVHKILPKKQCAVRYPLKLSSVICVYSSDSKKKFISLENRGEALKDALDQKRELIKNTEHRIRKKSVELVRDIKQHKEVTEHKFKVKKDHLIKDILATKAKVKEKIEEVVEKENVLTVPNILCITRIVMSPYLGYLILQDNYNFALGLLVFAGVTDLLLSNSPISLCYVLVICTCLLAVVAMCALLDIWTPLKNIMYEEMSILEFSLMVSKLDGWIARNWKGQSTKMGSFLDPMADKVLIATLFITLTWQELIPLALTLLIVGRDAVLVGAGFVIRYMSLPPPRTLSRYFDVTHATAQLAPTFISKVNTAVQLLLVGTTLASPVFGYVDHPALQALCALTAASTVVSALSYLISKDTYRILKKKRQ